ncbi:hypothetical protein [Pseudomonas sp. SO81]|uniref:hypothetical protein n=1 Tax=Pseudomonas sp. SO81 TaxID=2983246 RepID=UPI0025A43DA5|nr:hypothetical protein [Pseudomonas sp. SO81]WJN61079.1 hypothetical protein OH686_20230 [Pseudomonas sp. SO81]
MTTISTNSPLASYLASGGKAATAATPASQEKPAESTKDPIAELRSLARQMVARSEGGLLRALQGGSGPQLASDRASLDPNLNGDSTQIELPDVATLDREDAAKLLVQVNKLIDAGLGDSKAFTGSNGDKSTDSLTTYRDWLQEKGGISIYV